MFSKIKSTLEKKDSSGSSAFADVMKFEKGHTYRLRLLPNLEDPEKTFFHHYVHMWNSRETGNFISALSLQTFGEKDPIGAVRWKEWNEWKKANPDGDYKDYDGGIDRKENWFINVLVMEDPVNEENNGTVKVLKMGPQIKEILDLHTEGVKSKNYGWDIFDPEANIDLVIVAEEQGRYTTFKNSFFEKDGEEVPENKLEEVFENLIDLEQIYPARTYEELEQLLEDHYFCGESTEKKEERKPLAKVKKPEKKAKNEDPHPEVEDESDDIPFDFDESDEDVDELLAGLED